VDQHETYLSHRAQIEEALACICRRERLSRADAEDFSSSFRLRLFESDCAILKAFEGRSSLRTYLLSVIAHSYQDWRNARLGKWRNSSQALRLGPLAVQLERLLVRDELTLDEAYETLRDRHETALSRAAIEELAAELPSRSPRRFVPTEVLAELPAGEQASGESMVRRAEAASAASRISDAIGAALVGFTAEDRIILRLRFEDDFSVAQIARSLQLDQARLYRRLGRLLDALRAALQAEGLTPELARDVLAARGFDARDEARKNAGIVRHLGEDRRVEIARGK
jgi:RNA polymerase sigma factor for flagellar operon FliA